MESTPAAHASLASLYTPYAATVPAASRLEAFGRPLVALLLILPVFAGRRHLVVYPTAADNYFVLKTE
jgi:hypothetical protein